MGWLLLLLASWVVVLGIWGRRRARELFRIEVRGGAARVAHGPVPPAFLRDLEQLVEDAGIPRATIRLERDPRGPRLTAAGVSERQAQRLRNVYALHR